MNSSSSPMAESDDRWLHSRLTYSDADNSSIASSPVKRGGIKPFNFVELSAESIGNILVRTIVKELSISLTHINFRCTVDDIMACGEIVKTLQMKLLSTPQSDTSVNTPEVVEVNEDVSLLQTTPLDRERQSGSMHISHSGALISRCGDCNSNAVILPILKKFDNLSQMFAESSPTMQVLLFWSIFTSATSYHDHFNPVGKLDKNTVKSIQRKMVSAFKNYSFGVDAWGLIVVPTWLSIPRVGNITTRSKESYLPMLSPVTIGSKVYIDGHTHILSIEGELKSLALSGIRTAKCDVSNSSSKLFSFVAGSPCTVYICIDQRVRELPKWVFKKGFNLTSYRVQTNTALLLVYAKQFPAAAKVTVGGCASSPVNADNLFILVSRTFRPAYRKSSSEMSTPTREPSRFNLSRGLEVLMESESMSLDLNHFRWQLHKHSPLLVDEVEDMIPQSSSNSFQIPVDQAQINTMGTRSSNFDMYRSLQLKTRYKWHLKFEMESISVSFENERRSNPDIVLHLGPTFISLKWLHYLEEPYGFLPRFDVASFKMRSELDLQVACSANARIDDDRGKIKGDHSSLEYMLEPIKCSFDVSKVSGVSLLKACVGSKRTMVLNLAPPMLYTLVRAVTLTKDTLLGVSCSSQSGNKSAGHSSISSMHGKHGGKDHDSQYELNVSQLIFHNQLGQEIHMKLVNTMMVDLSMSPDDNLDDAENESNTYFCSIKAQNMVKIKIPEPTLLNNDPVADLLASIQTGGWNEIDHISFVSQGGESTYPLVPIESDDTLLERMPNGQHFDSRDLSGNRYDRKIEKAITHILTGQGELQSLAMTDSYPYALRVTCKLVPIDDDEGLMQASTGDLKIIDLGTIFGDDLPEGGHGDNSFLSEDDNELGIELESVHSHMTGTRSSHFGKCQHALLISFRGNVEFVNESGGTIDISVVNQDNCEDIMLEVDSGERTPLPLCSLRQGGFTMQKVWGCDLYISDPVDVSLLRESLNTKVPSRLRLSRQHVQESVWIYYKEDKANADHAEHVSAATSHSKIEDSLFGDTLSDTLNGIHPRGMSTSSLSDLGGCVTRDNYCTDEKVLMHLE